ncbi:MAG TPA: riboflavin biosynthesis protein RibF [Anaeromyxobacter sp.]|nr:riboflavin biosynthesis protein RibF [Anaeromyxobacter sp.]
MLVHRSLWEAARAGTLRGGAVAVGNMDGVHLGHRRLVEVARELAPAGAGVLTFEPHPVRVLRPQLAPPLITPLTRKLELLAGLGLAAVVVHPFDGAYASTPAAEFVARDLSDRLGVAHVVVGQDFTAGHERARVEALAPLLAARGIALHVVEPVTADGLVVSSTKIREFLLEGMVEAAGLLLARPYDIEGRVVRGAGRGRAFGFATANVEVEQLLPANGVYVVRARVGAAGVPGGAGEERGGVCNVGVKPTVEAGGGVSTEVHLLDFDGRDLYGSAIRVAFLARLRDERRFPSVDALRAQIAADVAEARAVLAR